MHHAAMRGPFGVALKVPGAERYSGKEAQKRAYIELYGRLSKVMVGPFKPAGIVQLGPYRAFDDPNAQEFASTLVDGIVAAIGSEDAKAIIRREAADGATKAVKPMVIAAIAAGGLGFLAGVAGFVVAAVSRRPAG
jgi:hypothetical protein